MPITRMHLAWLCCTLQLVGMIYAPFLQSACFFGLTALAIFDLDHWRPRINPVLGQAWRTFWQRPDFWAVTLHFLLVLTGIFFLAGESGYWISRLRIKLPFVILPFVFLALPVFSDRLYKCFWYCLLLLLSVTSLGIMVHYGLHFREINALISQGQPLPMPCNHIRYSLLQAIGIIGGLYLWQKGYYWRFPAERYGILGMTLFLILSQHLIAVRSGVAVLYAVLLVAAIRHIWLTRRYLTGLALLAGICALPLLAYQFVPSFKSRIDYMRYDLDMSNRGDNQGQYSDGSRWLSIQIGWELFRQSPWLGVGAGNLQQEVDEIYQTRYPGMHKRLMPHNQFVSVMAGSGILGLLLFVVAFFLPLLYRSHYRHGPFLLLHVVVFLSCMVEGTLENALGVAIYLLFLMVGIGRK